MKMARRAGRDQVAATVERLGWEAFEKPLPAIFRRAAAKWPGLVLDVGANTGFYTLLAASAHTANRVVAFEPVPEILEILNQNVLANDLQDRVRLIRCAVSDGNGQGTLYLPAADHGNIETSASLSQDFKTHHSGTIPILKRTLDRVLLRPSLLLRRVSLIKIDVEGCEALVLAGARRTITRHRPIVFIEILWRADMAVLNRIAADHDYADVRLRADGAHIVARDIVYDEAAWNHALVPQERLAEFLAAA